MMASEQNKQAYREFIGEVFQKGNLAAIDKYLAAGVVDHSPFPGQKPGLEGAREAFAMFRGAFPDIQFTLDILVAEGDLVVGRGSWTGTHKSDFMGIPATGKQVTASFTDIVRYAEGQIVEHWGNQDDLGMMQQLGLVPAMAAPATA